MKSNNVIVVTSILAKVLLVMERPEIVFPTRILIIAIALLVPCHCKVIYQIDSQRESFIHETLWRDLDAFQTGMVWLVSHPCCSCAGRMQSSMSRHSWNQASVYSEKHHFHNNAYMLTCSKQKAKSSLQNPAQRPKEEIVSHQ